MKRSLAVVLVAVLCACARTSDSQPPAPAATEVPVTTAPSAPVSGPRVTFPNGHVVAVEIANDDDTRAQGLMFRDQVKPGTGMLFLFPTTEIYAFWMKNTIIPLDMIWIAEDGTVVDVKSGVPPCQADPCPSYTPAGKAKYVLEVGSGVAKQQALLPGARVRVEGIERFTVR